MLDDVSMMLFQFSGAYSFLRKETVPVLIRAGRSDNSRVMDTVMVDRSVRGIPFMNWYCGYDRELSNRLGMQFYYLGTLFGRGEPQRIRFSHQVGITMGWYNDD